MSTTAPTPQQTRLYDLADLVGKSLTHLGVYDGVITPFKLDRIALANAQRFVRRDQFTTKKLYTTTLETFANIVATSYMNEVHRRVQS